MAGMRAQGRRVALRPARQDDLPLLGDLSVSGWGSELLVITLRDEDRPVGVIQYRLDKPSARWATIDHVAVEEGSRRWGLGQDAVRLFEEVAEGSWGVAHFKAAVDAKQGLGLYLWLRLGYRPLEFTRDPSGREALVMVRDAA